MFVLSTGRCGSLTFVHAASHIRNYTAAHESRADRLGEDRFAYPDDHIEADNRLSWFLGDLDRRFGKNPFYVHLQRDVEATARSYARRWRRRGPAALADRQRAWQRAKDYLAGRYWYESIIEAFGHAIVTRPYEWSPEERLRLCRDYVRTVNSNIEFFLRDKPSKFIVRLENAREDFDDFWERIGASGDRERARAEWSIRHNASVVT